MRALGLVFHGECVPRDGSLHVGAPWVLAWHPLPWIGQENPLQILCPPVPWFLSLSIRSGQVFLPGSCRGSSGQLRAVGHSQDRAPSLPPCIHPSLCPQPCIPHSAPCLSLPGISLCSATPWQALQRGQELPAPADPRKTQIPPNPTRAGHRVPQQALRDRQELNPRDKQQAQKQNSVPLPCLAGNTLPGNPFWVEKRVGSPRAGVWGSPAAMPSIPSSDVGPLSKASCVLREMKAPNQTG